MSISYPFEEGTRKHRVFLYIAEAAATGATPDLDLLSITLDTTRRKLAGTIRDLRVHRLIARLPAFPRGYQFELCSTGQRTAIFFDRNSPVDHDWLLSQIRVGVAAGKSSNVISREIGCAPSVVRAKIAAAGLVPAHSFAPIPQKPPEHFPATRRTDFNKRTNAEISSAKRMDQDACGYCGLPANVGMHSRCGSSRAVDYVALPREMRPVFEPYLVGAGA